MWDLIEHTLNAYQSIINIEESEEYHHLVNDLLTLFNEELEKRGK